MQTHLTLDGTWAVCPNRDDCPSPVHADLSIEDAEQLPERFIEQLAEAADPPTYHFDNGLKNWQDDHHQPHRDYDLPATIYADGTRAWYYHGVMHRRRGQPTRIEPNGHMEWWRDEHLIRTSEASPEQ